MDEDFNPWWRDGICAQIGPDLFFVNDSGSAEVAKAACRLCPVRAQCLADAVATGVEYGIFGGFGRDTRRHLSHLVERGADPMTVAKHAIAHEKRKR